LKHREQRTCSNGSVYLVVLPSCGQGLAMRDLDPLSLLCSLDYRLNYPAVKVHAACV
jgi:hypothetical protein